jgi:hypothetical protein
MELFKIEIIYPITASLHEKDELDEIQMMRIGGDEFITDFGYFNLVDDPILQIVPRCIIPKGKTYKKYFLDLIFASGNMAFAVGKQESVFKQIAEYEKDLIGRVAEFQKDHPEV